MRKLLRPHSPWDISPDSLIFSDLHLHERKEFEKVDEITGLNSRLVEGLDILKQIIDILKAHPEIKWVYSLGDFFELKDKVPAHILLEFQRMLEQIERGDVFHTALLGNHDFNLPKYPTIKIFDLHLVTHSTCFDRVDGIKVGFIPFQRSFEDFLIKLKEINNQKPNIVFFHQEIPGVTYETGRSIPGIFPKDLLNPNTSYISGHIHKSQTVGQIQYVGSPYQIRFSDEGQTRYIWVLNSKTRKIASIKLHYPEFISLDVQSFLEWEEERMAGNYIRVVGDVPTSQWDPNIKKDIRSKLEAAGVRGVSFQVNVIRQHQSQIPPEMVEDDDSIINLYVQNNGSESGLSWEELLRVGRELFNQ
jgi:hypothetical protein